MQALKPWTGMTSLKQKMDRLFDRFLEPVWAEVPALGGWEPKIDITESKDAVIVKGEVPGVEQKDLSVSLEAGLLTIKGEKHQEKEEKERRHHRVERRYGACCRVMRLPAAVDGSKATTTFKDGVITITLPKAPATNGTTIPVKAA